MSAAVYIEGVKRPPAAIVVALVGSILLAAGCGGGGGAGEGAGTTASTSSETLESLWRGARARASGRSPAPRTSRSGGTASRSSSSTRRGAWPSDRPRRSGWRGVSSRSRFARTTARLEPIGVPGGETADAGAIYVARIDTPSPGTYWYLAQPVGGRKIQALGNVVVKQQSAAPSVGDARDRVRHADAGEHRR